MPILKSLGKITRSLRPRPQSRNNRRGRAATLPVEALESRRLLTNFLVTTADDTVAADSFVSLREAIQAANTNDIVNEAPAGEASGDAITFAASLAGATITLGGTELFIGEGLSIDGEDRGITIDGDELSRIFQIDTDEMVSLANLTLTRGRQQVTGGGTANNVGGAISILGGGTTHIDTIIVMNCYSGAGGGGLHNEGSTVTIEDSMIVNNSTVNGGGVGNRNGGT